MNRHFHRLAQYAAFLSAAIACATLLIAGAGFASVPSHRLRHAAVARPLVNKSTTMNQIPRLNRLSGRAQVRAFVAYFTAKCFRPTVYTAKYAPSERIETLEYHATRRSRSTNKVEVSFSKRCGSTTISMD